MTCPRSCFSVWSLFPFPINHNQTRKQLIALAFVLLITSAPCVTQDAPPDDQDSQPGQVQAGPTGNFVTLPAGTRLALVLTHPIQSRHTRRGDDIYAQVTSPVALDNEVVIPPGTFVQATVDRIERRNGRGVVHLQSMSIIFPDGYVAPIAGPIVVTSDEGYALQDPAKGTMLAAFALPAAGVGLGSLIGHSLGHSTSTTFPGLPPSCGVPTPGCSDSTSTVLTDNSGRLKSTAIGGMAGLAIGGIGSLAMIMHSHNFFLDVGSPVEMTLQEPLSLQHDEVEKAVRQSGQRPVEEQPIAPRPQRTPMPNTPTDHGTCYTPSTPDAPGTPYPCP